MKTYILVLLSIFFVNQLVAQPNIPTEIKKLVVIDFKYDNAQDFSKGIAPVLVKGKWGIIDKNNKSVLAPSFDYMSNFSEDKAIIMKNYYYQYINTDGNILFKTQYDKAEPFSQGLAGVKPRGKQKYGFINEKGDIQIPLKYSAVKSFSEDLAAVKLNKLYGFIEKTGVFVIDNQYENANSFGEGMAAIKNSGKWGFIDKSGKEIIKPQYDNAAIFNEGLCSVKLDTLIGFIDKTGKKIIDFKYDDVSIFSEGLAAAKKNDKWGYIDKKGKWVIQPVFDFANEFSEGLACVSLKDKTGKSKYGFIKKPEKQQAPEEVVKEIPDSSQAEEIIFECGKEMEGREGTYQYVFRVKDSKQAIIKWTILTKPFKIEAYEGEGTKGNRILKTRNLRYTGQSEELSFNSDLLTVVVSAKKSNTKWKFVLICK